jgi:host factor-I protein
MEITMITGTNDEKRKTEKKKSTKAGQNRSTRKKKSNPIASNKARDELLLKNIKNRVIRDMLFNRGGEKITNSEMNPSKPYFNTETPGEKPYVNPLRIYEGYGSWKESDWNPVSKINSPNDSYRNKDRTVNMQDSFINNCRHNNIKVDIYCMNNQVESGRIVAFDSQTIIMSNESSKQYLVMKSAIVMIKPLEDVDYIFNIDHRSNNNNNSNNNPPPTVNQHVEESIYPDSVNKEKPRNKNINLFD